MKMVIIGKLNTGVVDEDNTWTVMAGSEHSGERCVSGKFYITVLCNAVVNYKISA